MLTMPDTLSVPLRVDSDGAIRIGKTRVLLEIVIRAFNRGDTPEGIVQSFSALSLQEVYAVIAYYLSHQAEVHAYMEQVNTEADQIQDQLEARQTDTKGLRERLMQRMERQQ